MSRYAWSMPLLVLALSAGTASKASSQALELASRGPRFIAAWTAPGKVLDASNAAVLRRRVSLDLTNVTADEALRVITQQADLEISYSRSMLPGSKSVSLHAREITVAAALTEVLLDAGVDVAVAQGGHMALVKRLASAMAKVPAVDTGAISGRITDQATGAPIVGATVIIEGTRHSATTESDGRYRVANILVGTYRVRARYIGYTPLVMFITVSTNADVAADFALVKSVQLLDEVVTTGTLIPTEVKALPTPITVVTDSQIALQRPATVMALFRQTVPTGVSFTPPALPYFAGLSVRGSSTLSGGTTQMKIFLDGMEVALHSSPGIDPNNIERMEVIRGPQAAAIYGSDAIGGVIQVFTKRGDPDLRRPQVSAEASVGITQTPYPGFNDVLHQGYRASVRGGGPGVSYNLRADYGHIADWLPRGELSAQSNYGVAGGIRYSRGRIVLDVSGRYWVQKAPAVSNPDFANTGLVSLTKPNYRQFRYANQTIAARLDVTATDWWQHSIRLGIDGLADELLQERPRLTTPIDTLLSIIHDNQTKTVIAYNTTVKGRLSREMWGSFTAGVDHYHLPFSQFLSFGVVQVTGSIQNAPGFSTDAFRTITNNTGYFGQVQLGFREAFFLTAGLRAERNTNFGDRLDLPLSPRVGLSYVKPLDQATLKFRGSWGRAIRPPTPGQKDAGGIAGIFLTVPNPNLGPERQAGWDAGVDVVLGTRGSVGLTYYDQTAHNLIQSVQQAVSPVLTFQNQNVGRVKNRGVEIEGLLAIGPAQLRGQYGYVRASIEELAPNYTGDLRVGDQALDTPKHTAGASLSIAPFKRTTISAGITYIGSWDDYDFFSQLSCFGGTAPCRVSSRDYIIAYPGFTKLNASVFQQLGPFLSGYISLDNLTNNHAVERNDQNTIRGRVTTVGLRFQY